MQKGICSRREVLCWGLRGAQSESPGSSQAMMGTHCGAVQNGSTAATSASWRYAIHLRFHRSLERSGASLFLMTNGCSS